MDTIAAPDEGEPESVHTPFSKLLLASLFLLFLLACNQKQEKAEKPPPVVLDTAQAAKLRPLLQDTITETAIVKKKVYLTFDDGPNKGTPNVLGTVKAENITASFFIVGKHVADSPEQTATWELLKADTAIELCNHSYTHANNQYAKFYSNPEGVINDFKKSQEKLQFANRVTRMPGRNAWRIGPINKTDIKESKAAIDSVHKAGFDVMGWDIEWAFDHKTLEPDSNTALLLRRIRNLLDAGTTKTPGHLVLLAHDQSFQKEASVEKLRLFLQQLKQNPDYEFIIASKYPGVKKGLP
jgi:peptidoglycan-N-acetylglucosamine deacetylase